MGRPHTAEKTQTAVVDWRGPHPECHLPGLVSLITGEGYEEAPVPRLRHLSRAIGHVLAQMPDEDIFEALSAADLMMTLDGRPLFKMRLEEVLERPAAGEGLD